jgi:hypothetical protein
MSSPPAGGSGSGVPEKVRRYKNGNYRGEQMTLSVAETSETLTIKLPGPFTSSPNP